MVEPNICLAMSQEFSFIISLPNDQGEIQMVVKLSDGRFDVRFSSTQSDMCGVV
jgi:hypothetical protein